MQLNSLNNNKNFGVFVGPMVQPIWAIVYHLGPNGWYSICIVTKRSSKPIPKVAKGFSGAIK